MDGRQTIPRPSFAAESNFEHISEVPRLLIARVKRTALDPLTVAQNPNTNDPEKAMQRQMQGACSSDCKPLKHAVFHNIGAPPMTTARPHKMSSAHCKPPSRIDEHPHLEPPCRRMPWILRSASAAARKTAATSSKLRNGAIVTPAAAIARSASSS